MGGSKNCSGSLTDLEIVQYPHPTLRHKSKPITRVDRELRQIVSEMFELMYAAKGIGLAANQVDLPIQLFVINTMGDRDEGEELVFINPVITKPKGSHDAEEGCLSIVGVNAMVARPEQIHVSAYDLSGNETNMTVNGLLSKAIQHETDHLEGVLFIDRISDSAKKQIEGELEDFEIDFDNKRATGEIPDDESIMKRLAEIEAKYCS
ncbi:MAG: peptide deformylase [Mariniblastus sp.]|nr:peptide deformylase [Mariniblastus sp.]